jgi:CRISPR-associated protein Cas1
MKDLHILPRIEDGWSFLYAEHCRVDQDAKSIAIHDKNGSIPVPCAMLSLLVLGPGSSITHSAIRTLADNGCMVQWSGEEAVRFYALGMGETRSSRNLLFQARSWADPKLRMEVVRLMYTMRFEEPIPDEMSLQEIRGREGVRVRETYAQAAREYGVGWKGRDYKRDSWGSADPLNRALSCANSCLYGVCHAAIVSAGYSPAIGFIHTGKMLSFVYDIADVYKTSVTVPAAFRAAAEGDAQLESRTRHVCRDLFCETRLLEKIVPDLHRIFRTVAKSVADEIPDFDGDEALPGPLWDPVVMVVEGGVNRAEQPEETVDGRIDVRKGPGIAPGRTEPLDDRAEDGRFRR